MWHSLLMQIPNTVPSEISFWPAMAMFLLGVVVALGGVWFTHVKGAVSRNEMEEFYNNRVALFTNNFTAELVAIRDDIGEVRETTARMEGQLSRNTPTNLAR